MKMLMAVCAAALLAAAPPGVSQQVIMTTGGTVACTPQVTVTTAPNQTTTIAGFTPTSFTFDASTTVQLGGGSGASVSAPKFDSLKVTKIFDQCSEPLIANFLRGQVIPTVTLMQLRTAGQANVAVMTITLTNAVVTGWALSSGNPGQGQTPETLTFAFGSVCIANTPIAANGTVGTPTSHCYNLVTNTAT